MSTGLIRIKTEISDKFNKYLKEQYHFNSSRYKKNNEILIHNNIITRVFSSKDSSFFIKKDSFELKINKKKIINYRDETLKERNLISNSSVSLRFWKDSNLNMYLISSKELARMKQYAKKKFFKKKKNFLT